jgi:hypothetical protein
VTRPADVPKHQQQQKQLSGQALLVSQGMWCAAVALVVFNRTPHSSHCAATCRCGYTTVGTAYAGRISLPHVLVCTPVMLSSAVTSVPIAL